MTGGTYKTAVVLVARAVGADCSSRGSRVEIRWDERAELGSLIVWVKFVIDLFSDEFCRWTLALMRNGAPLYTCLREHLRG